MIRLEAGVRLLMVRTSALLGFASVWHHCFFTHSRRRQKVEQQNTLKDILSFHRDFRFSLPGSWLATAMLLCAPQLLLTGNAGSS